jgi:uncharacterized repeat protein (TIGR01451 family)
MPTRRTRVVSLAVTLAALVLYAFPQTSAGADPNPPVSTYTYTANMEPLGASLRANTGGTHNSDLAFWGNRLYQGDYAGFRIIDISNPEDPQLINDYKQCTGTTASNQGDVIVWNNILVRSWNSTTSSATLTCDGEAVPPGFEGLHIFDVSNAADPDLVASINLPGCGSHTATGVPDLANNRLLVYDGASSATCPIFITAIPFANPAGATLMPVPVVAGRSCHDISVILGTGMFLSCAGGDGFTVFSLGGSRGGTLTSPMLLYTKTVTGVSIAHSSSFSWNGQILIFGHEPGGGSGAQCQATTPDVNKTLFFYDSVTGTELGRWVLPRPQASTENCTVHNFNTVPSSQRNILVHGSYQSGIGVVDFTNPAAPVEIAYADPAPLVPTQLGGDWSSYWYDGIIYESDITRGLITWRLNDPAVAGASTLGHLNPQTQEFTIPFTGGQADLSITKTDSNDPAPTGRNLTYTLTVTNNGPDASSGVVVTDNLPPSVTFVSATPSQGTCGPPSGGIVTCNLGTIGNGSSATVQIVVKPTQAGSITNTASVNATTFDQATASNSDSEETSVCRLTSRRTSIPCG